MKVKVLGLLSVVCLMSGAAFGFECDPKFYVGAEGQVQQTRGPKEINTPQGVLLSSSKKPVFQNAGGGGSAIVGTTINENLGLEAGYTLMGSRKPSLTNNNSAKTKSHNVYADVQGLVPVSKEVDLVGSVGVGYLTSQVCGTSESQKFSAKSAKAGLRAGVGAKYKINDNLSTRIMLRHQQGNKYVRAVNSVGVGLFYQF